MFNVLNKNSLEIIEEAMNLILEGEEKIPDVDKETVVLIIGKTGAGKSGLLNYIAGKPLEGEMGGSRIKIKSRVEGDYVAKISDPTSVESQTDVPNFWETENTVYCDCPGFGETRGEAKEVINAFFVKGVLNKASGCKIVLVIDQRHCEDRCDIFLEVLKSVESLLPDFHQYKDSMAVIVSKINPLGIGGTMEAVDEVHNWVGRIINQNNTLNEQQRSFLLSIVNREIPLIAFEAPRDVSVLLSEDNRGEILNCINNLRSTSEVNAGISVSPSCMSYVQNLARYLNEQIIQQIEQNARNKCDTIFEKAQSFEELEKNLELLVAQEKVKDPYTKTIDDFVTNMVELINDDRLRKMLLYLDFCIQINAKLKPSEEDIKTWKMRLRNVIAEKKEELLSKPLVFEKDSVFTVTHNRVISLKKIKNLIPKGVAQVNIHSGSTIFIDDILLLPSVNISMIGPTWKIVDNPFIQLKGLEGGLHSGVAANGEGLFDDGIGQHGLDGRPGNPGGHGGNLIGIGDNFYNLNNLTIDVSGGTGGRGQNGGNGADGSSGLDGSINDVLERKSEVLVERKALGFFDQDQGMLGRAVHVVRNFTTFNTQFKEVYRSNGELGHRGGKGGKGGGGGIGGREGKVRILSKGELLELNLPKIIHDPGMMGDNGDAGRPGQGGRNGTTYYGEYINEAALPFVRGIREQAGGGGEAAQQAAAVAAAAAAQQAADEASRRAAVAAAAAATAKQAAEEALKQAAAETQRQAAATATAEMAKKTASLAAEAAAKAAAEAANQAVILTTKQAAAELANQAAIEASQNAAGVVTTEIKRRVVLGLRAGRHYRVDHVAFDTAKQAAAETTRLMATEAAEEAAKQATAAAAAEAAKQLTAKTAEEAAKLAAEATLKQAAAEAAKQAALDTAKQAAIEAGKEAATAAAAEATKGAAAGIAANAATWASKLGGILTGMFYQAAFGAVWSYLASYWDVGPHGLPFTEEDVGPRGEEPQEHNYDVKEFPAKVDAIQQDDCIKKYCKDFNIGNINIFNDYCTKDFSTIITSNKFKLNFSYIDEYYKMKYPLHKAAINDRADLIELLWKSGKVNLLEKDHLGRTALHVAVAYGGKRFIQKFVSLFFRDKSNDFLEMEDVLGNTPLHFAIVRESIDVLELLLSYNVNLCHKDKDGYTINHLMINYKKGQMLEFLFNHPSFASFGPSLTDERDSSGRTALHLSSRTGFVLGIELLCALDGYLEALDFEGMTPLHSAIVSDLEEEEKLKAIAALLHHGASIEAETKEKLNALKLANSYGHTSIVNYLQNYLLQQRKSPNVTEAKICNLVFQGGSVKGIAYLGALEALDKNGIKLQDIERVGGTSAGAITATLLSAGYDIEEAGKLLDALDFKKFLDGASNDDERFFAIKELIEKNDWLSKLRLGLSYADIFKFMGDINEKYGIFKGEFLRNWIEEKLAKKTGVRNITFKELNELQKKDASKKGLYLIGTNISTEKAEIFSYEHTPNMIISDAVRISMSIPFLFVPHQRYDKNERGERILANNHFYIDGGVLDNYPVWLFDNTRYIDNIAEAAINKINPNTLGFRLVPWKEKLYYTKQKELGARNDVNGLFSFMFSIVNCYMEKQESDHDKRKEDIARTIYIDTIGIQMSEFNLSEENKRNLKNSGYRAADEYCRKRNATSKNFSISSNLLGAFVAAARNPVLTTEGRNIEIRDIEVQPKKIPDLIYEFYATGTPQEIDFLHSLKINMNAQDENGDTALHYMVRRGNKRSIDNIIKKNVKLNTQNFKGESALDVAVCSTNTTDSANEIIRKLLRAGAYICKKEHVIRINAAGNVVIDARIDDDDILRLALDKLNEVVLSKKTTQTTVKNSFWQHESEFPGFYVDPQSDLQNGWHCFDVSVGTTRKEIVKHALKKKSDAEVRNLVAPEIFQALVTTGAYLNATEQERRSGDFRPRDFLPAAMYATPELEDMIRDMFQRYTQDDGREEYRLAILEYCSREEIYEQYVMEYYGGMNWFAFNNAFLGDRQTSMIDVVAHMLSAKITVHLANNRVYETEAYGVHDIHVAHVNENHFVRLIRNTFGQSAAKQIQSTRTNTENSSTASPPITPTFEWKKGTNQRKSFENLSGQTQDANSEENIQQRLRDFKKRNKDNPRYCQAMEAAVMRSLGYKEDSKQEIEADKSAYKFYWVKDEDFKKPPIRHETIATIRTIVEADQSSPQTNEIIENGWYLEFEDIIGKDIIFSNAGPGRKLGSRFE